MIKRFIATAALLVGGLVGAHASPVLTFVPSSSSVMVGQTFTVDITIADVTDLFGWQLDMGFAAPGLLSASGVTEGSFLGLGTSFGAGTIDNSLGTITTMFSALTGGVGANGGGLLATVSFQAVAAGVADLSFSNVLLSDSNLDPISTFVSQSVNVLLTPIPEPETYALMLAGLGVVGLAAARRRARV